MDASIFFQGGTLVLHENNQVDQVPIPFQFVKNRWRCEAYRYHSIVPWMKEQGIRNAIPRWQHITLVLHDTRPLHEYHLTALDSFKHANGQRSVLLRKNSYSWI